MNALTINILFSLAGWSTVGAREHELREVCFRTTLGQRELNDCQSQNRVQGFVIDLLTIHEGNK